MARDGRSLARRAVDPPEAAREHPLTLHLPYVCAVDDDVLMLRDGDVMASIVVEGLAAATADHGRVEDLAQGVAAFVAQAGEGVAVYLHRFSTPAAPALPPMTEGSPFAQALDARWRAHLAAADLRERATMLTLVLRPAKIAGLWARVAGGGRAQLIERRRRRVDRLNELLGYLLELVADARPRRLGVHDGRWLGSLRALVTGSLRPVAPGPSFTPLADLCAASRVDFDGDAFTVAGADAADVRQGAIFGIKRYPASTEPGLFDRLDLGLDTIVTHSFTATDPLSALERVRRTARQMAASDDAAISLRAELEEAADDLASGRIGFGLHHASVAVFAPTLGALDEAAAQIRRAGQEGGAALVREDMGARATYFAQHPGNYAYRPRPALISSRNFADFIALHASPRGAEGGPWGPPLTVLPTARGEPYRVNLHLPGAPGERTPGHTLVIGRTGSGKTLGTAFLAAQAERAAPRIIVFDKDNGLEMAVRALGGAYASVRMGAPSGFNPFAAETDDRGAAWLADWAPATLIGADVPLSPVQAAALAQAARANAETDPALRTLSHFRSQLRAVDDGGELHQRLGEWDADGRYGWLFSGNGPDQLRLDARIMGFDLTEVFDAPRVRTAWLSYVFRRIERIVEDERPTLLILDEAWKLLDDPYFQSRLKDWMLTMRKKNVAVVLLTQRVAHIRESAAGGSILESAATLVLFPSSRNTAEELKPLNLTDAETAFLCGSGSGHRLALVRSGDESVVVDFDLSALGPLMRVLGGGKGEGARAGWRERADFWRETMP